MHRLPIDFTKKKISPWGGIHLFQGIYEKFGLRKLLQSLKLPKPGSNRGYSPVEVIESFLVSVVLGSKRLAHSGMLRSDEVIKDIFKWDKGCPSASTFSRFFQRFTKERNDNIFPKIQRSVFDQVKIKKMTIDIDSTVITRYGNQEHAVKGYNPEKKGKPSHHPLLAFCDDMKMVVNAWMRTGDSHSNTDMDGFIDELFEIIDRSRIGMLRMDSGFYSDLIMTKLESYQTSVEYIIKARMTQKLRASIYSIQDWHSPSDKGYDYSEVYYKATGWKEARRMVITRKLKKNIDTENTSTELFKELVETESYDYYAFVTNTTQSCSLVHQIYNKRGECENIIKELKYDYSIDGFALRGFYPMEAAFRLTMLAYNVMVIFKQSLINSKHSHRLTTIKFQCIAIGSYIVKNGRNKMLKLSAEGKRRHFLENIFEKVEALPLNFSIS